MQCPLCRTVLSAGTAGQDLVLSDAGWGLVALPSAAERDVLMKYSGPEIHSSVIDYAADVEASHLETRTKSCQIQTYLMTLALHKPCVAYWILDQRVVFREGK